MKTFLTILLALFSFCFSCSKTSKNEDIASKSAKAENQQVSENEESLDSKQSASLSCALEYAMHQSGSGEPNEDFRIGAAISSDESEVSSFDSSDFLNPFTLNSLFERGDLPPGQLISVHNFSLDPKQRNSKEMTLSFYRLPGEVKFGLLKFKTCVPNPNPQVPDPIVDENGNPIDQSEANCLWVYKVPDELFLKKFALGKAFDICSSKLDITLKVSDGSLEILEATVSPR